MAMSRKKKIWIIIVGSLLLLWFILMLIFSIAYYLGKQEAMEEWNHKFPTQKIKDLLPVKFTKEWALFWSIPVSESNTSLLILLQATIQIAAVKKVENMPLFIILVSAKATAVPTQIGITATLYIGGLIAAIHNLEVGWDFGYETSFVVIGCN